MDSISIKILKIYSSRACLNLSQLGAILNLEPFSVSEPISFLRKNGYLRIEANHAMMHDMESTSLIDPETPLEITFLGKATLESELRERKRLSFNEMRAWITAAIAVAAFVKSFFF